MLGGPNLLLNGAIVRLDRRKAEALLAYLVVEPTSHRRSELSLMLWPGLPASKARAALRRTLRSLTGTLGKEWFTVNREYLAVRRSPSLWCDVALFEHQLDSGDIVSLAKATVLYEHDFLSGLTLRDANGFDEWQRRQAERLRARFGSALRRLVAFHTTQGSHEEAIAFAERWMSLDPLDEHAHHAAMTSLMNAGRRSAALRLYDVFASRLELELGIDPPPAMLELRRSKPGDHSIPRNATPSLDVGSIDGAAKPLDSVAFEWHRACQSRSHDRIQNAMDVVYQTADRSGQYRDGILLLDGAFESTEHAPLLGRLLARQAVLHSCLGEFTKARPLLETSLDIANKAGDGEEAAFCENRLGCVSFAEGRYARARDYLRSSERRYRRSSNVTGLAWTLNVSGHLSIGTHRALGILTECMETSRKAKDDARLASTLNSLGKEAYVRRDFHTARRALMNSLELRRALGHKIGVADSLTNLGNVLASIGERARAFEAFEEAFDIAHRIQARPLLAEVLVGLASVRDAYEEPERAAHLAAAALFLPGGWRDAKDRASEALFLLAGKLPPEAIEDAVAAGRHYELRRHS